MPEWRLVISDVIVLAGLAAMTLALAAMVRVPDVFVKLHAATKAIVVGTFVVLAAAVAGSGLELIGRALLVAAFLLMTAPVSAHALAHLEALRRGEVEGREPRHPRDVVGPAGDGKGETTPRSSRSRP